MSIIIVEPTSSGVALVTAAHRMGKAVHVFTQDSGQLSSACRAQATTVLEVDTNDVEAIESAARSVESRLAATGGSLAAIVPGFEYMVDKVAQVAERLGLPHLRAESAALTRNKFLCRERLRREGFAVPRYALISHPAAIDEAAREVGFPAVLKPVDGCGSLLVRKVDSLAELRRTLATSAGDAVVDMGNRIGRQFLLEEFLEGREFSIEGHITRGTPQVVAITEKQLGPEPFFVEMGHVVPAEMADADRDALVSYIERVVTSIGLDLGAFHAEARLTSRGPVLIEIAARLGGDRIYRLVELAHGTSIPEMMIRSYCDEAVPPVAEVSQEHGGVAGIRFLSPPRAGILEEMVRGPERVRAMPGFQEIEIYFEAGQLVPELTDFRGRLGHVLFRASDRKTLDHALERAESAIEFAAAQPVVRQESTVE